MVQRVDVKNGELEDEQGRSWCEMGPAYLKFMSGRSLAHACICRV